MQPAEFGPHARAGLALGEVGWAEEASVGTRTPDRNSL